MLELKDFNLKLLNLKEAADLLGISVASLRKLALNKQIGHIKILKFYYFREEDIKNYIDKNTIVV